MSIYKKETTGERFGRVGTRIFAIIFGLFTLYVVATVGTSWETFTMEDATVLRTVAMTGFMGWMFVFIMSMRPLK